jgi:CotH kinase protein/Lamin Tail Domain
MGPRNRLVWRKVPGPASLTEIRSPLEEKTMSSVVWQTAALPRLRQKGALRGGLICLLLATILRGAGSPLGAAPREIVINEIMYHPPGSRDDLQYVEICNPGAREVDLSKWSFTKGIKFIFPEGAKLGPGTYLVVCANPAALARQYGQVPALGPFKGHLSHRKERIELADARGQVVDSVQYSDQEPWPGGADGYSSSLERICPSADSDTPENWAASTWPARKGAAGTPGRQNDCYSSKLPPVISKVEFSPRTPTPRQKVKVTATVADSAGVKAVALLYQAATFRRQSEERAIPMTRGAGNETNGIYEASIDAQPQGVLVRFRIQATDTAGTERLQPSPNEPRPTYSYFSFATAHASISQGYALNLGRLEQGPGHYQPTPVRGRAAPAGIRGAGAFLYIPAESGEAETFDYVHIRTRSGGYKIHFQKDRPLKGMTGINVILEGPPRWVLAEPLAYVLYRMAGVPAPLTEHMRLTMDGRLLGYHLLIEQPNKSFLTRNGRDSSGNLYKLIWYGQGITGQHEKKTNPTTGHADIIQLIEGLRRRSGASQWAFIQENFNVEECINYYAVNMCIQNWDGFFNNYFVFHNTGRAGKWEIYPWDEDKTWGDYDGASPRYDWYEMPLTFGMNGDNSPRDFMHFGGGPFGGTSWWRPPGYLSGPLLANPEFRKLFLARLYELCMTAFTEESFDPIFATMQKRLEPEVRLRAQAIGQDPRSALREFTADMQSFHNQVRNRRKFILAHLAGGQ